MVDEHSTQSIEPSDNVVEVIKESEDKKAEENNTQNDTQIQILSADTIKPQRSQSTKVPVCPKSGQARKNWECFGNYTRFVILFISTFCLTCIISNSLAMNFSIICMNKPNSTTLTEPLNVTIVESNNTVEHEILQEPIFSLAEQSALFSAIAIGTLLGTIPITYITDHFGTRKMFMLYGLLSAIATLLTPFAVSVGFVPVFIIRGFGVSTSFVAMAAISGVWSPLDTTGLFISWISCHLQFAPMFTMPVAGVLCVSDWGWPSIYYLQGLITLVAFFLFYYLYRDLPEHQPHISHKELMLIEEGKDDLHLSEEEKILPIKAMLSDIVVWGILISSFGGMLGFNMFLQYGPVYLNKVLKMDVAKTGLSTALPYALSCILKIFAGPVSDAIKFMSEKSKVIFFASLSQFVMAGCFAIMGLLPAGNPTLSQACFTLAIVFSGLNAVGVIKCTQLIAKHFSHAIMAWNTITIGAGVLILPIAVSQYAPHNTVAEWSHLFYAMAILVTIVTIFFNWTADVQPRPWTHYNPAVNTVKSPDFINKNKIFAIDMENLNDSKKENNRTNEPVDGNIHPAGA